MKNVGYLAIISLASIGSFGLGWILSKNKHSQPGKKVEVVKIEPSEESKADAVDVADVAERVEQEPVPQADIFTQSDEPFIITQAEYQGKYGRFDERGLVYYQDDGLLVNAENDVPVVNIEQVLGSDAVWELEQTDEDVLYVHDPDMATTYVIDIVHGPGDELFPEDDDDYEEDE